MTKDELADALAREAIASICQPPRCEAIIVALAKLAKGEAFSAEFPPAVYELGPDGNRRLARLDAAGAPICPRQHLSPAAEQRALRHQGPCRCASCMACRARPMTAREGAAFVWSVPRSLRDIAAAALKGERAVRRSHCEEHAGWRSDCDACAAAVDAKQSVLHLHEDGSVTVRSGPEAVAEWEQAMQRDEEEP